MDNYEPQRGISITKEMRRGITTMLLRGNTTTQIQQRFRTSGDTILRIKYELGLGQRHPNKLSLPPEIQLKIAQEHHDGAKVSHLVHKYERCASVIYAIIRRHSQFFPEPPPPPEIPPYQPRRVITHAPPIDYGTIQSRSDALRTEQSNTPASRRAAYRAAVERRKNH